MTVSKKRGQLRPGAGPIREQIRDQMNEAARKKARELRR